MTPFEYFLSTLRQRIGEIESKEAAKILAADEALLIDVREHPEWQEGRIPGALHIPRSIIEIQIGTLIPNLETPLILHCSGGIRSLLAAENLHRIGYTHVQSLAGGTKAWRAADLPFVHTPPSN